MPAGRNKTQFMAGLHIVRKPLKYGDRYYVYAWRGGPCIHSQDDSYPVITHEILAKQQQVKTTRYGKTEDGFEQIISDYRESPEFAALAESTRKEYRRWLDRASERFGQVPLRFFDNREMRGDIIEWRNLWADQPRTADMASMIMNILCGWAVENGRLSVNVASKIKKLHEVNRADLIWEDRHFKIWEEAKAKEKKPLPSQLDDAMFLALWTGLRLGDLVAVTWDELNMQKTAIIRFTNKGKKRETRAVIPILPPLKAWMDRFPEEERVGTILKNSRGKGWTEDGLQSVIRNHKPKGLDRTFHDLRGTFCTRLMLKGLTDEQIAMIMGWKAKRIAEIRARYVDEATVILSLVGKLSA